MNGCLHYDSYLHILDEEMIPTQGGVRSSSVWHKLLLKHWKLWVKCLLRVWWK